MKKELILLLILVLFISSCQKSPSIRTRPSSSSEDLSIELPEIGKSIVKETKTVDTTELAELSSEHPRIFLNQQEIDAIKLKVQNNEQPWKDAYTTLMSSANGFLSQSLLSVT